MRSLLTIAVLITAFLAPACTGQAPDVQKADAPAQPAGQPVAQPVAQPVNAPPAAEHPLLAVKHIVVISIDGLRPDLAMRADMPNLRSVMDRGSYSLWARTTELSVTLPSHVSMLTGVTPEKHKITWNDDRTGPDALTYPSLLDRAKAAGYSTALIAVKAKFRLLAKSASVDHSFIVDSDNDTEDVQAGDKAVEFIKSYKPDVMFVHFGSVDGIGHRDGWGTPTQIRAIELVDRQLGRILSAINDIGETDSTAIIISADHGGAGKSHGANDPRSRHIPWIAAGPGFRQNYDLTGNRELTINTEDTYATACWLLGLDPGKDIDGKPIKQIEQVGELLQPKP
jgi:hypothetical protein